MGVILLEILDSGGDVLFQHCYESDKAALRDLTALQHAAPWFPKHGQYSLFRLNRIIYKNF